MILSLETINPSKLLSNEKTTGCLTHSLIPSFNSLVSLYDFNFAFIFLLIYFLCIYMIKIVVMIINIGDVYFYVCRLLRNINF